MRKICRKKQEKCGRCKQELQLKLGHKHRIHKEG